MPLASKPRRSTSCPARGADSLRFVGLSAALSSGDTCLPTGRFRKALRIFRVLLIATGVALVVAGLTLGDTRAIFQKALFICMECIGIG